MENKIGKLFIVKPKSLICTPNSNNVIYFLFGNWIIPSSSSSDYCNLQDKIFIFLGKDKIQYSVGEIHIFLFENRIIQTFAGEAFLKECIQLTLHMELNKLP
jgi:hypothetical protein